jgi:replicative DNA helicase
MADEIKLPCDDETERTVLGLIIAKGDMEFPIEADLFFDPRNRTISESVIALRQAGVSPDMVSVIAELKRAEKLDRAGGQAYISRLLDGIPVLPTNIPRDYYGFLADARTLRRIIKTSKNFMDRAVGGGESSSSILADMMEFVDEAASEASLNRGLVPIAKILDDARGDIDKARSAATRGEAVGIVTGFSALDALRPYGLHAGDLVIVGGRPGTGKTTFMLNLMAHMADAGARIACFSLEMASLALATKILSAKTGVPSEKIQSGYVSQADMDLLETAADEISARWKVWIDDTAGLEVDTLRPLLKSVRSDIDIVMIDYLQMLRTPQSMARLSEYDRISYVCSRVKALAKSQGVTVIACTQLSRSPEKRSEGKPKLADLRGSGQIEQDADLVIFMHRPGAHFDSGERPRSVTVIVSKQRSGPEGEFELAWDAACSRFGNMAAMPFEQDSPTVGVFPPSPGEASGGDSYDPDDWDAEDPGEEGADPGGDDLLD